MEDVRKKIDDILEESEKRAKANEDLLNLTSDVTFKGLGILLELIDKGIREVNEGMAQTQYFDKGLGEKLQGAISSAITAFTQVKHEINFAPNFAPNIVFDTTAFQKVISEALNENKRIYTLVENLSIGKGDSGNEAYKMCLAMIEKHNNYLEKLINRDSPLPASTEWQGVVTKRDSVGRIDTWSLKAIK